MKLRAGRRVAALVLICCALGASQAFGQNPPAAGQPPYAPQPGTVRPAIHPPQPGAALPNGAPAQPRNLAVQPPFVLTPAEQAELEAMLRDWETKSAAVKTFKSDFTRLEYNPAFVGGDPNQPKMKSKGILKYAAPDKGLFHVSQMSELVQNAQTKKWEWSKAIEGEYWACNGKTIYQIDRASEKLIERPIPPHLQGQSITEGPLPFVFGAKAESLKQRYFMRLITPAAAAPTQVWLEARPRTQQGAAEFSRVELILTKNDMIPYAIQIYNPGAGPQNQSRTVITFDSPSVNNPWVPLQQLFRDFSEPALPLGYTREVEKSGVVPPPTATPNITTRPAGTNQATQPRLPPR